MALFAAATLLLTLHAAHTLLGAWRGEGGVRFMADWVYNGGFVLATALVAARAILVRRDRLMWWMFTGFVAMTTVGEITWTFQVAPLPEDRQPMTSIADLGWICAYPFAVAGFVMLVRRRLHRSERSRVMLDATISLLGVSVIGLGLISPRIFSQTGGGLTERTILAFYPIGDTLLFGTVVATAAVSVLRRDRSLLWLGLGMVTVGMADTAWGMFDLTAPSWMDTTWLAAPMCIAIGAWHEPVAQHGERTRGWRALIVPFAAMATATIVLAVGDRHHIGTAAQFLCVATLAAAVLRLAATYHENAQLAAKLQAAVVQAEQEARRTVMAERAAREDGMQEIVTQLGDFSRRVRDCDLTTRMDGSMPATAPLADGVNEMVQGIATLTAAVRNASLRVANSSEQIVQVADVHSSASRSQLQAMRTLSLRVEEVSESAGGASDRATEIAREVKTIAVDSQRGSQAMVTISTSMEGLREYVGAIAREIEALREQTASIHGITRTVRELADQSDMLSLNAAIEAARAGEQGRGFGVVADQVRALAEQSRMATLEVEAIIAQVDRGTERARASSQQGVQAAEQAAQLAREAWVAVREVAATAAEGVSRAERISQAVQEQKASIGAIVATVEDSTAAAEQINESAEDARRAATELSDLARELEHLTGRYRLPDALVDAGVDHRFVTAGLEHV